MWALLGEGEASGKKQLTGGAGRGFTLLTGWWKQAPVPSSQGMGRRWKPLEVDQEVFVDCWLRSPDPLAFSWTENMNKIQGRRWQLNGNCSWVKRWGAGKTVTWLKTVTWFQFLVWLPPSCHLLCKLQGSSRCPWFMPFLSLSISGRAGSQSSTCLWAPHKHLEGQALGGQDAEGCRGREVLEPWDQATSIPRREELCHRLPHLQMGFNELLSQRPGSPGGSDGKEPACNVEDLAGFRPRIGKIPLEKKMATRSSILAWRIPWTEEPGWLQPMGPQRDTTKRLTFSLFSQSQVLEPSQDLDGLGCGYPLQYSCLENPMDRGAWWATVHGVVKSQTRLSTHTCTRGLDSRMAEPGWASWWSVTGATPQTDFSHSRKLQIGVPQGPSCWQTGLLTQCPRRHRRPTV